MATDAEIEVAAKAMFVRLSTNDDASRTWNEILKMPQHATTISFYRAHALAALDAAEKVREPVVFEHVADSGTTYRCEVNGPAHIVVEPLTSHS